MASREELLPDSCFTCRSAASSRVNTWRFSSETVCLMLETNSGVVVPGVACTSNSVVAIVGDCNAANPSWVSVNTGMPISMADEPDVIPTTRTVTGSETPSGVTTILSPTDTFMVSAVPSEILTSSGLVGHSPWAKEFHRKLGSTCASSRALLRRPSWLTSPIAMVRGLTAATPGSSRIFSTSLTSFRSNSLLRAFGWGPTHTSVLANSAVNDFVIESVYEAIVISVVTINATDNTTANAVASRRPRWFRIEDKSRNFIGYTATSTRRKAFMMSSRLGAVSSSTIRPSASITTRSAYDAATGSCVTIITV